MTLNHVSTVRIRVGEMFHFYTVDLPFVRWDHRSDSVVVKGSSDIRFQPLGVLPYPLIDYKYLS